MGLVIFSLSSLAVGLFNALCTGLNESCVGLIQLLAVYYTDLSSLLCICTGSQEVFVDYSQDPFETV